MFIKITRVKADGSTVEQYINTNYIIGIRPRENDEGTSLDIAFPDTVRTYNVAEKFNYESRYFG